MSWRIPTLALGLVLAFAPAASAQTGTLRGVVRSGESGEALFAANVLVTSLRDPSVKIGRLSNRDGEFSIPDLPAGPYEVRASYVGYETRVIAEVQVAAGGTASVDLALTVEPIAMNKVVISASRHEEKVIDAPAAVQLIEGKKVRDKATLNPGDHLSGRPAVDVQRAGLNQGTVVVRGFNNIFSGATLTLVDNRIARVPSLRYNALNLIPTSNEDIAQIELVSGPGSALYGPNSANGVLHIRTLSPFESQGTEVSVAGGDQELLMVSGRHAGSDAAEKVGWKVTAAFYQGEDFESVDPVEQANRAEALPLDPDTKIGLRDFDIQKASVEGRLDIQVNPDALFVLNGGFNQMDAVELTGLGAAQVDDWRYGYGQARLTWGDFFVQGYVNASNAGDSYNLRTGADFVDQSMFIVGQAQHEARVGDRHSFIYGVDALLTRPDTEGTINGRNEDDDDINEIGGYLQAETELSEQWDFVGAVRVDDHNHLEDPVFSPRAALVYGPRPGHKLRATYNRAFSTPTTNNLFLDLLASGDLGGFGASTGGLDGYDLRAKGVPGNGFRFRRDGGGGLDELYMQVPTALRAIDGTLPGSAGDFLPADATEVWDGVVNILLSQGTDIRAIPAPTSATVGTVLRTLNPTTGGFDLTSPGEVQDVEAIKPTITNTFEFGYKGLLGDRAVVSADVYHSRIEDFVGPLRVETPNVFFDPATLGAYLSNPAFGLSAAQVTALTGAIAGIPVGTVAPEDNDDPGDLVLTYRNFGEVDLTGFDLALSLLFGKRWTLSTSYSFVSEDFFENVEGELDVALNAPKHKAGVELAFSDDPQGFDASVRVRHVTGFPVESGVFVGEVDEYTLVDLAAAYDLPGMESTNVSLVVQNLLDDRHREFVGVPVIGRVGILRLTQRF